ncbi:hypothetical protein HPB50_013234 [Hyalomma asiaticum]|uniref:Uncharacterized protein n=1 Tax=Hyalomma asiaticum TaxID=266040 RepID=A0ACB7TH79_HYAAI|nr:hypothetical protein HPB50_013234 [Hyalomma asiaticum]
MLEVLGLKPNAAGVRAQNVPVSGPMLRKKAQQFATILEVNGLEASSGWLHHFRQRNGVTWQTVSGEKAAGEAAAATWKEESFHEMVKSYAAADIFNAGEMTCFYKLLPDKMMHFKGEQCKGSKKLKLRVTVLYSCNEDGSEKLKPLVIRRFSEPRCMKNVVSLPCQYRVNQRAWMTRELFSKWLLTRLVHRLLINLSLQHSTAINVRQAAEMLTGIWWSITSTTIQNCWKKAGLMRTDGQPQIDERAVEGSSSELWSEVAEQLAVDPSVTFDDYVECNESVQGTNTWDEEYSDDMDDDVTVAPEDRDESVPATDALDYLRKLRIFIEKSSTATETCIKMRML